MVWAGIIISTLIVAAFAFSAVGKFAGGKELEEGMAHLGLPESMVLPLGILELTCAVIYAIPQTAVIGAILLTGYIGGAICTHWRVGDPFYIQIGIGLLLWLGVFLRDRRLRMLIPLRAKSD
jgi:hypothetical protein